MFTCVVFLREILQQMGLDGQVSPTQAAKKWDNLKQKYKVRLHLLNVFGKMVSAQCDVCPLMRVFKFSYTVTRIYSRSVGSQLAFTLL